MLLIPLWKSLLLSEGENAAMQNLNIHIYLYINIHRKTAFQSTALNFEFHSKERLGYKESITF